MMTVKASILVAGRQLLGGDQFSSVNLGGVGTMLLVAQVRLVSGESWRMYDRCQNLSVNV